MTDAPHSLGRTVRFEATFDGWRAVGARSRFDEGVHPESVSWEPLDDAQRGARWRSTMPAASSGRHGRDVRRRDAQEAACPANVSPTRTRRCPAIARRTLGRPLPRAVAPPRGEPHLLDVVTDPDVHALGVMDRAVRRAAHKMKAFVRFRLAATRRGRGSGLRGLVRARAPRRGAHRAVLRRSDFPRCAGRSSRPTDARTGTARRCGSRLVRPRSAAPTGDELETLWRTYYAHIFNPAASQPRRDARRDATALLALLPEARLIGDLARDAPAPRLADVGPDSASSRADAAGARSAGRCRRPCRVRASAARACIARRVTKQRSVSSRAQESTGQSSTLCTIPGAFAARDAGGAGRADCLTWSRAFAWRRQYASASPAGPTHR